MRRYLLWSLLAATLFLVGCPKKSDQPTGGPTTEPATQMAPESQPESMPQ